MINHNNVCLFIRGIYSVQKLRIQIGNRICAQFKAKLGQAPGTSEDDLDDDSVKILDQLRTEFKKITDGVKNVKLATFKSSPLISDYTEFCLLQQYLELEESEERHLKNVEKMLVEYPIWNEFLSKIPGCGPKMGGIIISEIDIKIAKYPSSLWQYAGLGVEPDGAGTSRRKEHLKVIPYTDKDGNPATRVGIRFNPFLKTKLIGVLGPCILKSGTKKVKVDDKTKILDLENSSSYVKIYLNYKNRLENHSQYGVAFDSTIKGNKAHRHNMAIRYMIKRFLVDLYNVWRKLENLPVAPEYGEAKLGHIHGAGPSFSAQG
jgi:hypothetical protein